MDCAICQSDSQSVFSFMFLEDYYFIIQGTKILATQNPVGWTNFRFGFLFIKRQPVNQPDSVSFGLLVNNIDPIFCILFARVIN